MTLRAAACDVFLSHLQWKCKPLAPVIAPGAVVFVPDDCAGAVDSFIQIYFQGNPEKT